MTDIEASKYYSAEILLRQGAAQLQAAGLVNAALEARLLLQGLFGLTHAEIISGRARLLNEAERRLYARALERRAAHEPVYRILGCRDFYGREFALSAETLEPRSDTEALIDLVLPVLRRRAARWPQTAAQLFAAGAAETSAAVSAEAEIARSGRPASSIRAEHSRSACLPLLGETGKPARQRSRGVSAGAGNGQKGAICSDTENRKQAEKPLSLKGISVLDIGTGSGIIALTLLAELPALRATGADISADALATAQKNAENLGVAARFAAIQSDCFSKITGKFDFILSNPPYIPCEEINNLAEEVRKYDPRRALDGGADGLDFYRILAAQSAAHLKPCGIVAVEAGFNQAEAVCRLFTAAGFRFAAAQRDLNGIDRALLFAL